MADTWEHLVQRIAQDYFQDASRRLFIKRGEVLLEQDCFNDRLYFIISGAFSGAIRAEDDLGEEQWVELFRVGNGEFLGVSSFFSRTRLSSTRVTALSDGELAWIDRATPPVQPELHGSLRKQFIPVIIEELSHRQVRLSQAARERESVLRRLHLAEKLSTLGQLSAGLAHELNNAVGVLSRGSDHLVTIIRALLQRHQPELTSWFEEGLLQGQAHSSADVRARAKALMAEYHLDHEKAKTLARILGPSATLPHIPGCLDDALDLWETGRDCHDMRLAARHASSLVRSIRQLGGGGQQRQEGQCVNQSIKEALALLQNETRQVQVVEELSPDLPPIWGNMSELVQIWVNIIKNGVDAVKDTGQPEPRILLRSLACRRGVEVRIANNGPPIPEHLLHRIFQPNLTTKKGEGSSMGLGLGLCIVKRLVDSYSGELQVESLPDETVFVIRLPLRHESVDMLP